MADAEEAPNEDKGARALECQQDNPKRDQSKSWRRYEAYKSATTVAEFLAKGGTPADLAHDVGKGFVWYLDEGPHINPVAKRERKPPTEKPKTTEPKARFSRRRRERKTRRMRRVFRLERQKRLSRKKRKEKARRLRSAPSDASRRRFVS